MISYLVSSAISVMGCEVPGLFVSGEVFWSGLGVFCVVGVLTDGSTGVVTRGVVASGEVAREVAVSGEVARGVVISGEVALGAGTVAGGGGGGVGESRDKE